MSVNPYESSRVPEPLVAPVPKLPFEVEYELTLEDYVAFSKNYYRHSTSYRVFTVCTFLLSGLVIAGAIAVYITLGTPREDDAFGLMVFAALIALSMVAAAVWTLIWGPPLLVMTEPFVRHMATRSAISSLFGRYTVRISETDIFERAPKSEQRFVLSAVQKMILTPQCLYLYVSPVQAFLIPRRAFADPREAEALVALLEQRTGVRAIR